MTTLRITAWHSDKAWSVGTGGFTHHILSKRLQIVADVRGVALRRLTRRVLRRQLVDIPLRDGVDPATFISYLAAYGGEVRLHSESVTPTA